MIYLLTAATLFFCSGLFDLKEQGLEQYQDVYVKGTILEKASFTERFLETRFSIVHDVLKKQKGNFTMLDVGASQGYFSFKAADLYPNSLFIMLEGSNPAYPLISKQLSSICEMNRSDNVIWLDSAIEQSKIETLATLEHFDVVLALNVLHWFPNDWKQILASLQKMSNTLIIETPPIDETLPFEQIALRNELEATLVQLGATKQKGVPRHTNLSLYTTYYIIENKHPIYNEHLGIQPATFSLLNGAYPKL